MSMAVSAKALHNLAINNSQRLHIKENHKKNQNNLRKNTKTRDINSQKQDGLRPILKFICKKVPGSQADTAQLKPPAPPPIKCEKKSTCKNMSSKFISLTPD